MDNLNLNYVEEVVVVVVAKSLAKGGEAGCKSGEQAEEGGKLIQTEEDVREKKKQI